MAEIIFDAVAYSKIIFHAAKYPHCSVNGVLLADASKCKEPNKIKELQIVDSVPLFHLCLHVSPMVEIALSQVNFICICYRFYQLFPNIFHTTDIHFVIQISTILLENYDFLYRLMLNKSFN